MRSSLGLIWALGLVFCLSGSSFGDETQGGQLKFKDVAGGLRCPTCTGLSVLDSDAKFSVQIKDEVREQLAKGKNKEQILEFFTERYGPWILREPPSEGVNMLAWVIPILILVLGPLGIWFFLWRNLKTVPSYGVRRSDEIIREMKLSVDKLKEGR